MATHVTAITLTTDTSEHGPVWRLTWTKTHHTETAARRHATGLCAKRPPGTTVPDIFTDARPA